MSQPNKITVKPLKPRDSVQTYELFREEVLDALQGRPEIAAPSPERIHHLLNGGASEALNRLVNKSTRKSDGIFFSGQRLTSLVAAKISHLVSDGASIADPACGAGDLLLGCMAHASVGKTSQETISEWGKRVVGIDIHPQFAQVTQARIALMATSRFGTNATKLSKSWFPQIIQGDFLKTPSAVADIDCVVMNPPFGDRDTPPGCTWSSGKVQQAALFLASVVEHAKPNQQIVAVLPDVLRSGTRYARWRAEIAKQSDVITSEIYGRFDAKTDVDVFILHLNKREVSLAPTALTVAPRLTEKQQNFKLSDFFNVTVGSVVPHRHKGDKGQWKPYLAVDGAPIDEETFVSRKRRFEGRTHQAPFIVLRRTSSPSDSRRAVPCLISGPSAVAVENHLIVLQPLDGKLSTCKVLMQQLKTPYIDEWLDHAIRCRHLTTAVLKQLPLIGWTR